MNYSSEIEFQNEMPVFQKKVESFYLDKHLVRVKDFGEFITSTNYINEAEKFEDAGVYNFNKKEWELVKGANWEYPLGPEKERTYENHPVTQVSWRDAVIYSKWAGKRLPSE